MATMETLAQLVCEYKGEEIEITASTTFDDLGFDSLDKVDLMMQVEEKFDVSMGDDLVVANLGELAAKIDEIKG